MITQGDVLDVLQQTPDEHYAGCFCDPPYGLSFMGRKWDHGVPSSDVWREVWRVLRPGAVLMAFGGSRTWHRLAVNIEDAGFDMFDTIMWLYGSGFPKSTDIGKAIDKEAGQVREVVGINDDYLRRKPNGMKTNGANSYGRSQQQYETNANITAPATAAARTWAGYGSALKPSHEPILCFRKPRRGTYAQTAQEYGTGALWVDGCRVGTSSTPRKDPANGNLTNAHMEMRPWMKRRIENGEPLKGDFDGTQGRWPANIILDEAAAQALDEMSGERPSGGGTKWPAGKVNDTGRTMGRFENKYDNPGIGGDTGGASRFFYCAKASRSERERGLSGLQPQDASVGDRRPSGSMSQRLHADEGRPDTTARNNHPCVKPLALCEYLARLIVPPVAYRDDARLLVPFCGSGSEMIGALRAGWQHVDGIDNDAGYVEIARLRIAADMPLFAELA